MFSIWEKESFLAHQDVIIIGGGFTGLWSALCLKKRRPSRKITILERSSIPAGASTRNAGFACFGSPGELMHDAQQMGTEEMLSLVEMRFRGLKQIQKHFPDAAIDFNLCGGYELYETGRISKADLKENLRYLNTLLKPIIGFKKTYTLEDGLLETFGFGKTEHLVKNMLEGYLHSGKLIQALMKKATEKGIQFLQGVTVENIEPARQPIHVHAKDGEQRNMQLSCEQLLLCTNAFTSALLPDVDIKPVRGQVLVTSPIDGLPFRGTFHAEDGYFYFRNLGNRVLLGGARNKAFTEEETTDSRPSQFIQDALEEYLNQVVLPGRSGSYTIDHRWAGIMAMGSGKLPIVKEVATGVFSAVRMSGMGVALAPVAAQQVSKLMD